VKKTIDEFFPDGKYVKENEYLISCPFCGDPPSTHNHLYINTEKKVFYCFYCGEHGSLKKLLDYVGEEGVRLEPRKGITEKKKYPPIDFSQFYPVTGVENTNDRLAFTYLRGRGLSREEIEQYQIHYAAYGRYFGRVIVPIYEEGVLVCFVARSFLHFIEPKYLFPHHGETLLTTAEALFGYDEARKAESEQVYILVEGIFDAMAINRTLEELRGIALLSKHMSKGQLYKLLRLPTNLFYVMLDADAHSDALKVGKQLSEWGREVRICFLEEGDPASLSDVAILEKVAEARPYSLELETEVLLSQRRQI